VRSFTVSAHCGDLRLGPARDRGMAEALVKPVHYARWNGGGIRILVACRATGTSPGDAASHLGPLRIVLYRTDHRGYVYHCDLLLRVSRAPLGDPRRTLPFAPGGNARFDGFGGQQPLRFILPWLGDPERGTVRAIRLPAHRPPLPGGGNQVLDSRGIVFCLPALWDGPRLLTTWHGGIVPSGSVVGQRTA